MRREREREWLTDQSSIHAAGSNFSELNTMSQEVDAIVIGSGHNGLVSAVRLSRKGWKVLVVEQADVPGGAAKTAEVTLPGFRHDLYATNIGLFLNSKFYQENRHAMKKHGFEPVVSDKAYSSVFPDAAGIGVTTNPRQTHQALSRISSADADAWDELVTYFERTAPYFLPLMQMPLPSWQAALQLWRLFRGLKRGGAVELAQMLLKSPREFVDCWFESPEVKALVAPWALHLDFGPDISNGAVFPFIESVANAQNGIALARGGIGNLVNALASMLEESGGALLTGRRVERVLVENGRAVGVRLANGDELRARRAVIGNVTPTQLAGHLLEPGDMPTRYARKSRAYRYGPGTMMIHLALDEPVQWSAGEEYSDYAYVHIGPYVEDLSLAYTQAVNGVLPDEPLLVVGQPTAVDPNRAPAGKHILWVQVRALPAYPEKDSQGDWKEAYADRVIRKIARYAPNIQGAALGRAVLSPADLERDNPNLAGGDSVSGSHHLDQNYLFRPFAGWSRYRTPVKRLYMCGASTWPGGGLNATSGYLLAEQLL